ncbi:MAG: hypothetical protein ABIJ45_07025, partial [Candidatus Zixiibacteriota bacterium]
GKHYFSYLTALCGSYIINFEFGIRFTMTLSIILMITSFYLYVVRFYKLFRDRPIEEFKDKLLYKLIRAGITLAIAVIYLYRLYFDLLVNYI